MRDYIEIGPSPAEEDCAGIGTPGFDQRNREECRRFVELIREVCGPEPEGAALVIRSNAHDFGNYREVAVRFDDAYPDAVDYAFHVEGDAPARWDGSGGSRWQSGPKQSVLAAYMR